MCPICTALHASCVQGSVRETLTLNQKEYVAKIDQLNRNLERAWEREQKVKALKIAIQVPLHMCSGSGVHGGMVKWQQLCRSG